MGAKIYIRAWHGKIPEKHELVDNMNRIATVKTPCYEWEFEGTIQEFVSRWEAPFLAYPAVEGDQYAWSIFITQYSNFGARG